MATTDRTKSTKSEISSTKESEADEVLSTNKMFTAAYQIIIAMGIGTIISMFLENIGLIFPGYLGGLLMGLIIRNLGDYTNKFSIPKKEIDTIGEISLSLFISMALMTLKLWELKDLALPMLLILTVQVILIIFFTIYIAFRLLGKDYDSAVMVSGVVGFGLGAMPVAVANMQTLMKEHPASPSVFFVITAIGSLVIDISNSFLITFFMNLVS